MTALTQSTKRKLSLLQLAEELGNVSKACKLMGYHRDSFYEIRRAFDERQRAVADALDQCVRRAVPEESRQQHVGITSCEFRSFRGSVPAMPVGVTP